MKVFKIGELIKASDINSNFSKCIKIDLSNCPVIPCNKGGTGRTDCSIAYADKAGSATSAKSADVADLAKLAEVADVAKLANKATIADSSLFANKAGIADKATLAETAEIAKLAKGLQLEEGSTTIRSN